jgi:hypothetical protein
MLLLNANYFAVLEGREKRFRRRPRQGENPEIPVPIDRGGGRREMGGRRRVKCPQARARTVSSRAVNLRPAPLSKVGHGVLGRMRVHAKLGFQTGEKGFRGREMARFLARVELPEKVHDVRLRQERVNFELNLRLVRTHGVRWGKRESWPGVSPPRLLLGWILITFAQNSHFTVPSSSTVVLLLRPQFLQVQFRLAASMTHPLSRRRPATGATSRARVGRRGNRRPRAYHGSRPRGWPQWGLIFTIHYRKREVPLSDRRIDPEKRSS